MYYLWTKERESEKVFQLIHIFHQFLPSSSTSFSFQSTSGKYQAILDTRYCPEQVPLLKMFWSLCCSLQVIDAYNNIFCCFALMVKYIYIYIYIYMFQQPSSGDWQLEENLLLYQVSIYFDKAHLPPEE